MTTTHAGTPFRPERRAIVGASWRAALVVTSGIAVLLDAPSWLRAPLSIAAALSTIAFFLQRYRRRGRLDGWLTAAGTAVVSLALLGLLLNAFPFGLTSAAWAVGAGLVELLILVVLTLTRPAVARPLTPTRRDLITGIGWTAAVLGVLSGAVIWSASSYSTTHAAPLAMASEPGNGFVNVTVTSGREQGPYRLDIVTADGRTTLRNDVRVGPTRTVTARIELPADTRALLQLLPASSDRPSRELILDSTSPVPAS